MLKPQVMVFLTFILIVQRAFGQCQTGCNSDFEVCQSSGSTVSFSCATGADGVVISIQATGTVSASVAVNVFVPNYRIERIEMTCPNPIGFNVVTLTVRPKPGTSGSIARLGSVRKVSGTGDLVIALLDVQGNIGPGNIIANTIGTVEADGFINSDITTTIGNGDYGMVGSIRANGGAFLGSVYADGRIQRIIASGPVGSSSDWAEIYSSSFIEIIQGSTIYAEIDTTVGSGGNLWSLRITSGNFVGSLQTKNLLSAVSGSTFGIDVVGDIDADVTITGSVLEPIVVGSTLRANRSITIAGSVIDDATNDGRITIASGGLGGLIVMNAANNSSGWNGAATIGTVTLSPLPAYAQASSLLGGGAIGLVPFRTYDADNAPLSLTNPNAPNWRDYPTTDTLLAGTEPVTLGFYGKVKKVGTGSGITVNRISRSGIVGEMPLDFFTTSVVNDRFLRLGTTPQAPASPGYYQVILNPATAASHIATDLGSGNPSPVVIQAGDPYEFILNHPCVDEITPCSNYSPFCFLVDIDLDGDADSDDITLFFAAWEAGDTGHADIDLDGDTDSDDTLSFFYWWDRGGC